jgi:predicted RNA-binding protein with TRAM domain
VSFGDFNAVKTTQSFIYPEDDPSLGLFWESFLESPENGKLVLDMYGDGFGGGYEAPVKVGERYRVRIESLGKGGDGIAKIKGFVIFVPNTQVGDEVEIVINSVKRKFAFGEVI